MGLATRTKQLSRLKPQDIRDRVTFARFDECLRVRRAMTKRGEASTKEMVVHPRALDGAPISVRLGTADATVVWDTFVGQYHLPPDTVPADAKRIWDLGTNIGLTVAHYATLFPSASITGVELDPLTAARAEQNIRPWSDRCRVVTGAVWFEDGTVRFGGDFGGEHGTHVGGGDREAPAFALDSLLADDDAVDFVKMDIEGAESVVLKRNVRMGREGPGDEDRGAQRLHARRLLRRPPQPRLRRAARRPPLGLRHRHPPALTRPTPNSWEQKRSLAPVPLPTVGSKNVPSHPSHSQQLGAKTFPCTTFPPNPWEQTVPWVLSHSGSKNVPRTLLLRTVGSIRGSGGVRGVRQAARTWVGARTTSAALTMRARRVEA